MICVLRRDGTSVCFQDSLAYATPPEFELVIPTTEVKVPRLSGASALAMASTFGEPLCGLFIDGHLACERTGLRTSEGNALPKIPETSHADTIAGVWSRGICLQQGGHDLRCEGDSDRLVSKAPARANLVAFGQQHACAVQDGHIVCWGRGSSGQLGAGPGYLHPIPLRVAGLGEVTAMDGSTEEMCVRKEREIICWGPAVNANATERRQFQPRAFPFDEPVLDLRSIDPGRPALGYERPFRGLCAKGRRGWRCFSDESGWKPRMGTRSPLDRIVRLAQSARDDQCGVTTAGRLVCSVPSRIATNRIFHFDAVTAASNERFVEASSKLSRRDETYVCGRTARKTVACFATGDLAQRGQAIASPSIAALSDVVSLTAASAVDGSLACALTGAGAVWCWGDDNFGQRGGGKARDFFEAVHLERLPAVVQVVSAGTFACARTAGGEVYCWGSNRDGGVPDGAPGFIDEPVQVEWPK
jgi:hypothetical protein